MDTILVGTDFGHASEAATSVGLALARRLDFKLLLAHAVEPWVPPEGVPDATIAPILEEIRVGAEVRMHTEIARLGSAAHVKAKVRIGIASDLVLELARKEAAEAIVIGTHGRRAPARWVLGSTAEALVRTSPVPVVVVRSPSKPIEDWAAGARTLRILLANDLEDGFGASARFVRKLAGAGPTAVSVVHAFDLGAVSARAAKPRLETMRAELEGSTLEQMRESAAGEGVTVESDGFHLVRGKPAEAIADLARELGADLVVVGTHGRRGVERLLGGSVAIGVLRRATMPVAVVPFA